MTVAELEVSSALLQRLARVIGVETSGGQPERLDVELQGVGFNPKP